MGETRGPPSEADGPAHRPCPSYEAGFRIEPTLPAVPNRPRLGMETLGPVDTPRGPGGGGVVGEAIRV